MIFDELNENDYRFEKTHDQVHNQIIGNCDAVNSQYFADLACEFGDSESALTSVILPKQSVSIFKKFLNALVNGSRSTPIILVPSSKNSNGCIASLNKKNSVVCIWNEKKGTYLLADVPDNGYSLVSIESYRHSMEVQFIRPRKGCIFALTSNDKVVKIKSPMIAKPGDKREPLIPLNVSKNFPSDICFRDFKVIINAISHCWPKHTQNIGANSTISPSTNKAPEEDKETVLWYQAAKGSATIRVKQSNNSRSKSSNESDRQIITSSSSTPTLVNHKWDGSVHPTQYNSENRNGMIVDFAKKGNGKPGIRKVCKKKSSSVTSPLSSESSSASTETPKDPIKKCIVNKRNGVIAKWKPISLEVYKRPSSSATSSLSSESSSASVDISQLLSKANPPPKKNDPMTLILAKILAEKRENSKDKSDSERSSDASLTSTLTSSTPGSSKDSHGSDTNGKVLEKSSSDYSLTPTSSQKSGSALDWLFKPKSSISSLSPSSSSVRILSSLNVSSSSLVDMQNPKEKAQGKQKWVNNSRSTSTTSSQIRPKCSTYCASGTHNMEKYVQPEGGCSSSLHGGENIEPPYSRQIDADSKLKPQQSKKEPLADKVVNVADPIGLDEKEPNPSAHKSSSQSPHKGKSQSQAKFKKSAGGSSAIESESSEETKLVYQIAQEALLTAVTSSVPPPPSLPSCDSTKLLKLESEHQPRAESSIVDELPDCLKPYAREIEEMLAGPIELPTPPSSPQYVERVPLSEMKNDLDADRSSSSSSSYTSTESTAKDSDDSSAGEVPNSPSLPEKPTPTKPSLTKSKIGPHPIPGSTELPNKLHKEVEKSMKRTSKWLSEKANLAFEDFSMSIKDKEDVETSVKRRMKGVPCSRLPLGTEEDCTDEKAGSFFTSETSTTSSEDHKGDSDQEDADPLQPESIPPENPGLQSCAFQDIQMKLERFLNPHPKADIKKSTSEDKERIIPGVMSAKESRKSPLMKGKPGNAQH